MIKHVVITLLVAAILGIAGFFFILYSGWYSVSAGKSETALTRWVLQTAKKRSVRFHSDETKVPDLGSPDMLALGFRHFEGMCVSCHGSPLRVAGELAEGLNPPAPGLIDATTRWTPNELFWIIKNGIKMTGMPAWGKSHPDQTIWGMVAVVQLLPTLTAETYKESIQQFEENDSTTDSQKNTLGDEHHLQHNHKH